jgi:hypothetical protein
MKNIITLVTIAVIALAIGYFAASYNNFFSSKPNVEQQSTVLLEKVKMVSKLVTVEGYFSEVWQIKKSHNYVPDFLYGKKAILKVTGKVSVGYNLEQMKMETFPEAKILRISNMPNTEIISVDHDLEYFTLEAGTFNSFSSKELSEFNEIAKDTLVAAANRSRLIEAATEKGNDIIKLIELIVKDAGWKVEFENEPTKPNVLGVLDSLELNNKLSPHDSIVESPLNHQKHATDATNLHEGYRPMAG